MTLETRAARKPQINGAQIPTSDCQSLRECLCIRLEAYFRDLDEHPCGRLHEMVMAEVEAPLLEIVVRKSGGNLSRAAEILGIHRATLRRKLDRYGLE
ncbi:MAG: helix-turn-helix domain-containing protein [Gammaproteobacteria bacterium]